MVLARALCTVLTLVWLHAQKSRQLGQNYISPEHIVLALFTTGDTGIKAVIDRCAVHLRSVSTSYGRRDMSATETAML